MPAPGTGAVDSDATPPPPELPTEPAPEPGSIEAPEKRNLAPTISGTPTTTTWVDDTYVFQPTASDADGDTLVFSIAGLPAWAEFDPRTGRLHGTPRGPHVGSYIDVVITVSDGRRSATLPAFSLEVAWPRKAAYGHYFATRYADKPADAARLCSQPGVTGVVWRRTWREVEPGPGQYDFSSFDQVLDALAASTNPDCQLWIFIEFKSFANSPVKNPCPAHLQDRHSALNADGNGAATCFMWEPEVIAEYAAMMRAAAERYDAHPRIEGLIFQESALGLNGAYSQDAGAGGTYTAEAWRDGLISLIQQCSTTFRRSRCLSFLNFIRNGQKYLHDVSAAIAAVPDNRACLSGPDLLPDNTSLYNSQNAAYEVLTRHKGCRSNSAQNDSYQVPDYGMDAIFNFAVRGTFGDFDQVAPRSSGVCVNSYLFWNNRVTTSATGLDWTNALPVIAAYPYGPIWLDQCAGGGAAP